MENQKQMKLEYMVVMVHHSMMERLSPVHFVVKSEMTFLLWLQEICPSNNGNGHQVPIFGDQVKPKPIPTLSGESYYGYGSATGRMSPRDSWEQGYLPDGKMDMV